MHLYNVRDLRDKRVKNDPDTRLCISRTVSSKISSRTFSAKMSAWFIVCRESKSTILWQKQVKTLKCRKEVPDNQQHFKKGHYAGCLSHVNLKYGLFPHQVVSRSMLKRWSTGSINVVITLL